MKYSIVFLAAAAGLVTAQDPGDFFPECAIPCLAEAAEEATDCGPTDFKCRCTEENQQAIRAAATLCVLRSCGPVVGIEVIQASQRFCEAVNSAPDTTTEPVPTFPFPTEPFPTFPFPTEPFPTFPFPTEPFPTFPFPTEPFPTVSTASEPGDTSMTDLYPTDEPDTTETMTETMDTSMTDSYPTDEPSTTETMDTTMTDPYPTHEPNTTETSMTDSYPTHEPNTTKTMDTTMMTTKVPPTHTPGPITPPIVTAGAATFGPIGGLAALILGALAL